MTAALDVLPYAVGFTAAALACLGAGVLIAKIIGAGNGPDLPCPGRVTVDDADAPDRPIWAPCPHRLPCPIHSPSRRSRGRQA